MRRAMDVRASIPFSYQTASDTRSQRRSDAQAPPSPTASCERSSSVVQHFARPTSSLRFQPVLKSRTTSWSMSNKLQLAACLQGQKTSATSDVSQLCPTQQSHHLTVCKLDGSVLCEDLHTRQVCIFGRSSCSSRRVPPRCSSSGP